MKILLTAGAGFIESTVIRLAMARGHSVVNGDPLTYAACLKNGDWWRALLDRSRVGQRLGVKS